MKRYQIMVTEYGADHEVCLCETDGNPEAIVKAVESRMLKVFKTKESTRRSSVPKYSGVRVVDTKETAPE